MSQREQLRDKTDGGISSKRGVVYLTYGLRNYRTVGYAHIYPSYCSCPMKCIRDNVMDKPICSLYCGMTVAMHYKAYTASNRLVTCFRLHFIFLKG